MSLANSFARASRRRRRFSSAWNVESLETRQLLATSVVATPGAIAYSSATDHHAQVLRLAQLNALHANHNLAGNVASPSSHAPLGLVRAHVTSPLPKHPFNDYVIQTPAKPVVASNLSVGVHSTPIISPNTGPANVAQATYSPVVGAYTPAQIRTAYGVGTLGLANQGQGVTIAIIDEFDDPKILNDANVFSTQYNLPQFNTTGGPNLTVYQDQALDPVTSAVGTGVGGETSLDVEWAHAMAPKANILLVEVPATRSLPYAFAELLHGIQYAAAQPGVVAASLSYGYTESGIGINNVKILENAYLSSGASSNIAVTVSSGDGSLPLYPATSPNVIAVGGTSLYLSSARGKYSFETAWGGLGGAGAGGGGLSSNFAAPSFQTSNGLGYGVRAIPDVSLIADPVTSVSIYDSLDTSTSNPNPWGAVGGTSLASPILAGEIALAQQNRIAAGLPILNSAQINSVIYSTYNSPSYLTYFRDITLGNNRDVNGNGTTAVSGYPTTTGYDLATGVGSPIGNMLVQLLTSAKV